MKWSFTDKTVVIIGSDDKPGEDVAAAFARLGASVYACGQDQGCLARLNALAKNELLALSAEECDIQNKSHLGNFLSSFEAGIDVVVVNANVTFNYQPATQIQASEWQAAFDRMFYVSWKAAVLAMPLLQIKENASLIFMTSSGVRQPTAENAISAVCSAGIESMTKTFSSEVASSKVRVNAVAVADEMYLKGQESPVMDVSGAVLFLASDLSSYCTGYMLEASGKGGSHG